MEFLPWLSKRTVPRKRRQWDGLAIRPPRHRVRLRLEELEPRTLLSFGDTPYAVGPTVTPTTTEPEAEEHIAVDPSNFRNLLIGVHDNGIVRLGRNFATTKYAFSADNGATWTEKYVPIDPVSERLPTADGRSWTNTQDPVVAIDKAGNAYLANPYLNIDPVTGTIHENGVYMSVSSVKSLGKLGTPASGGFTAAQTYPVVVNTDPNTPFFEDKEWIAVDHSTSAFGGNVYVSWTHLAGVPGDPFKGTEQILFSRSSDHGSTWSAPMEITSLKNWQGGIQGSQVAVGPLGEVYVVYADHFFDGSAQLFLCRSTDGGVTFSKPVGITANFHTLSFASTYPKDSWPSLAVSPTNGDVYVVYADQPNKKVGAEVELIRSRDGGATFSDPVPINDTPIGQQFMPAVTMDELGVIHASWFDTRNSPSDSSVYDVYATFSTDGGGTFRPNARVTATSVNVGASPFIGDYAGIAAGGGFAHPVWTTGVATGRTGGLRTATLTVPSGEPLLAASTPTRPRTASLTTAQAQPLLAEARHRWQAAGVTTSGLGLIRIPITELGGRTLGLAAEARHTIWLDDNAAGWGWFVDKTPWEDSEFFKPGHQGERHRIDLLTVLEHEVGHLLGKEHKAGGVMRETLTPGTRRMLHRDRDALFALLTPDEETALLGSSLFGGERPKKR